MAFRGFLTPVYTTTALLSRHLALVAASPQASIADLYRDDAFYNGAFMLAANFGFYPGFTNRQDDKPAQRRAPQFNAGTEDGYNFFLRMGTMKNSNDLYYKDTTVCGTKCRIIRIATSIGKTETYSLI